MKQGYAKLRSYPNDPVHENAAACDKMKRG